MDWYGSHDQPLLPTPDYGLLVFDQGWNTMTMLGGRIRPRTQATPGLLEIYLTWPWSVTGPHKAEHVMQHPEFCGMLVSHALHAALMDWNKKQSPFWFFQLPSWQRDFTAAAAVDASDTTLRVFAPAGATSLGRTTLDLEIQAPGAVYYRRITTVSAGPSVDGRPTIDLTMDSALGSAIAAAAFGRISTLRCVRFAADRIEYQHFPRSGLAVAVPCIEVPVP